MSVADPTQRAHELAWIAIVVRLLDNGHHAVAGFLTTTGRVWWDRTPSQWHRRL